jgi:hypothetical protein
MNDVIDYINTWKKKKWYGEQEEALAENLLFVLESQQSEEIVDYIDTELGVFTNKHPRYMNFLLDVRNMVQPPEKVEEECTSTEVDSLSGLVHSP